MERRTPKNFWLGNYSDTLIEVDSLLQPSPGPEPDPELPDLDNGILLALADDATVEDTNKVASVLNQYNGSKNLVKITDPKRPTKTTGDFDSISYSSASDDVLEVSASHAASAYTSFTMVFVFKELSTNNNITYAGTRYTGSSFVNRGFLIRKSLAGQFGIQVGDGSGSQESTFNHVLDEKYHCMMITFDSSGGAGASILKVEFDGVEVINSTTKNPMVSADDNPYREANINNSTNGAGVEIPFRLLTADVITSQEKSEVYDYLSFKYGIDFDNTISSFTYSSSIDSITNLYAKIAYPNTGTGFPVLVIMHGFSQSVSDFNDAVFTRMASRGRFVIAIGMRGRDDADGTIDGGGRETQDVIDGIDEVLSTYSSIVDSGKQVIAGWSGGAYIALLLAARYPDRFKLCVANFGFANIGYGANSWHTTNPSSQAVIEAQVGGTPAALPNEYKARNVLFNNAAAKNFIGHLRLYHDLSDGTVAVANSRNVRDSFDSESNTDYVYSETSVANSTRWEHALPNPGEPIIEAETIWDPLIESLSDVGSIPASGTIEVIGHVVSKRFTLILGNGTAAEDYQCRVGTLVYDYDTNSYTLTPDIDSPETSTDYSFEDDLGRVASGTISGNTATPFTPS